MCVRLTLRVSNCGRASGQLAGTVVAWELENCKRNLLGPRRHRSTTSATRPQSTVGGPCSSTTQVARTFEPRLLTNRPDAFRIRVPSCDACLQLHIVPVGQATRENHTPTLPPRQWGSELLEPLYLATSPTRHYLQSPTSPQQDSVETELASPTRSTQLGIEWAGAMDVTTSCIPVMHSNGIVNWRLWHQTKDNTRCPTGSNLSLWRSDGLRRKSVGTARGDVL